MLFLITSLTSSGLLTLDNVIESKSNLLAIVKSFISFVVICVSISSSESSYYLILNLSSFCLFKKNSGLKGRIKPRNIIYKYLFVTILFDFTNKNY